MKTLANREDYVKILRRLCAIGPASNRRWGAMTMPQMICHLNDALRVCLGEKPATPATNWFMRTVIKWAALWIPHRWPQGVRTVPECDANLAGTRPAALEADLAQLRELLHRFITEQHTVQSIPHPIFGLMTEKEWLRWAWLHMDHHPGQFGA